MANTTRNLITQQSYPQSRVRRYEKAKRIPAAVISRLACEIAKGTPQRKILAILDPYLPGIQKHNLDYICDIYGLTRKNLSRIQGAFIRRECMRAREEGREIPRFESLHRDWVPVRKTQIDSVIKKEEGFYPEYLDETGESCGIRIVGSDEDSLEGHSSEDVDLDADEELDGTAAWPNNFAVLEDDTIGFEPLTAVEFQDNDPGTASSDIQWNLLELNDQPLRTDTRPLVQDYLEKADQSESGCGPPESFILEDHWHQDRTHSVEWDNSRALGISFMSFIDTFDWVDAQTKDNQDSIDTGVETPGGENLSPKLSDPPKVWSKAYHRDLDQWTYLTKAISLDIFRGALAEQKASGDDIMVCFDRVRDAWKPKESYTQFLDWDMSLAYWKPPLLHRDLTYLLPPHILFTFLEGPESVLPEIREAFGDKFVEHDLPSPAEAKKESQLLRNIYNENFSTILAVTCAHRGNERWESSFRSLTVHLATIEEQFGLNHYYLTRAIFQIATVMERGELQDINDKDLIHLLLLLLNILFRLKLEDSPSGDIPHALLHLYRSLVRVGKFSKAEEVFKQYTRYCERIGRANMGIHNHKVMMLTGFRLLKEKGERIEGLKHLRQAFKFFERISPSIGKIAKTQGHSVTAFDFLEIGKWLRRAGLAEEAAASILKSIEHSKYPDYEMSARTYEGVHELGLCYEKGKPLLALTYFHDDLQYRDQRDIFHTAGPSLEAMDRIFKGLGLSQWVRPTDHVLWTYQDNLRKFFAACEKRGATDNATYLNYIYNSGPVSFIEDAVWPAPDSEASDISPSFDSLL
ncbi:hypothetical protein TWF281_000283 [Arthrobotrys megalospora]